MKDLKVEKNVLQKLKEMDNSTIQELIDSSEELIKIFKTDNISLKEISSILTDISNSDWILLRDYVIGKFIKNLITNKFFEISEDELTLKAFQNLDPEKLETSLENFAKDDIKYLVHFVNEAINDYGIEKELEYFYKTPIPKLDLSDICYEWTYTTRCDDYDCDRRAGDFFEMMHKMHRSYQNEILEYTIEELYNYAFCPEDIDEGEYAYLDICIESPMLTEEQFALLVLKFIFK